MNGALFNAPTAGRPFEIVPPELLARPERDELRRLDRAEAALVVDGYLRRLSSQEARCRRVLGTLASDFLRRRAHHTLGFVRVDDYARERLGLSGRELQSAACVIDGLRGLPALAAAFDEGTLSWTQARLLIAIARPETEAAWLAIARDRTVRALETVLRDARRRGQVDDPVAALVPGSALSLTEVAPSVAVAAPPQAIVPPLPPGAGLAVDTALDECAESGRTMDGEAAVTFRLRCPRWVPPLWRDAVELARRVAGESLAPWRAAEAIAAEGLSARTHHATSTLDADLPRPPSPRIAANPDETRAAFTARSAFDTIDWSCVVEAVPQDVDRLADDVAACDPHALDRRMRAAVHALHRVDWQLGRLLRLILDCRLYVLFGFASWSTYVRERLGISTRTAGLLVAIERKTWASPALMEAYRSGTLSTVRALTIAPVVGDRDRDAWIERASEVTLRRLADEVAWALDVRDAAPSPIAVAPPTHGVPLVVSPRQMRAPLDEELTAEIIVRGPATVVALLRAAIAAFHPPLTPAWTGLVDLLAHVKGEWQRLPRHRDPVFARDGWRCSVPACNSRRNLQDHHIIFRSRGGTNARTNRLTLCAGHHLHGIHDGWVRARGKAPAGIWWELGVRGDGPPLLRLVGEQYDDCSGSK